jgi:hypothetical protein
MNVEHFINMSSAARGNGCEGVCQSPTDWQQVAAWLEANPGSSMKVCKNCVDHPESIGMQPGTGFPVGQSADWRFKLDDCRDFHVQDFGHAWHAHFDLYSPTCGKIRHALIDLPKLSILASSVVGGLIGLSLGSMSLGSMSLGAGAGVVQGLASVLIAKATNPTRRPVCLNPGGCAS